ncbi:MAG: hypothetical protein LBK42_06420 [Propionibacteriaceae bacterium]|jgi:hypothetical protein|nr:hypothetical protein [Propionibacteriaceae bacterium]
MSYQFKGDKNQSSGNINHEGMQVIGDGNTISTGSVFPMHRLAPVAKRIETPLTNRVSLWLSIAASVVGIAAGAAGFMGAGSIFSVDGVSLASRIWMIVFFTFVLISIVGWNSFFWLRRRVYGGSVLGFTTEGRLRPSGRIGLDLVRLRGTCALCGSDMVCQNVPTQWVDLYQNGRVVRRDIKRREVQLVCTRNPDDERHRRRIDITETEA